MSTSETVSVNRPSISFPSTVNVEAVDAIVEALPEVLEGLGFGVDFITNEVVVDGSGNEGRKISVNNARTIGVINRLLPQAQQLVGMSLNQRGEPTKSALLKWVTANKGLLRGGPGPQRLSHPR